MFFFQWEPTSPDILIYRKYDKYRYLTIGIDMKRLFRDTTTEISCSFAIH